MFSSDRGTLPRLHFRNKANVILLLSMSVTSQCIRVAVSQHEPAWLNLGEAVEKTCAIIKDASEKGAKLVAFPECWVPGRFPTLCS